MKWVRCFLICCLSLFVISCDKETAMQPREEVSLKPDKSYEYEKIQKPELAFSKDMKQMYLIVNELVDALINKGTLTHSEIMKLRKKHIT